jgi:predicted MFS family arabinose efflux permease
LGYAFGGVIGAKWGWRLAFFAVTPPGLLLGILCFFMRDPPRGAVDGTQKKPHRAHWMDYLSLLRNRSYVLDTAGMAAMTFAMGGISYWMPRYVAEERHAVGLGKANLIFGGLTVAAGIIATLLGGIAGDKLRPRFQGSYFLVSAAGILLSCPFIVLMLYIPFPYAWGAIFLAEFWLFFNTGPSNTILANVTHPNVRATAFAMNIFLIHLFGDAISAPILGNIAGHFGWSAAFFVVTAMTAFGGILWLIAAPHLAPDTLAALTEPG